MQLLKSYNNFKRNRLDLIGLDLYDNQCSITENTCIDYDEFIDKNENEIEHKYNIEMRNTDWIEALIDQFEFDNVLSLLYVRVELDDILSQKLDDYLNFWKKDRMVDFCINELDHEDIIRLINEI